MTRPEPRRAERNTGAFLGPDMLAPVPMRTLSDDLRHEPTEAAEEREPEPDRPGVIRRVLERLGRQARRDQT
jgi:hypothetical protein